MRWALWDQGTHALPQVITVFPRFGSGHDSCSFAAVFGFLTFLLILSLLSRFSDKFQGGSLHFYLKNLPGLTTTFVGVLFVREESMNRLTQFWQKPLSRVVLAAMLLVTLLGVEGLATLRNLPQAAHAAAPSGCTLNSAQGSIKHVIYIQFDNTHFTRDNPNVPSDLEQMPHLLNFIEGNGVLLTNHHTPLISHTATDILTSLTGVYGDRHGVPVSNSFRYFNPDGTSNLGVSFAYWTDPLFDPTTSTPTDTKFNMLTADGHNPPAPWVAFTRAGCNVGSVATANTILENIATDIPTVFGAGSVQAQEVASNPGQAFADFVGIGIHCAAGDALCSTPNNGKPDLLPNEPGGYNGYHALYG